MSKKREAIRRIIDTMWACFPRASPMQEGAIDVWCLQFESYPLKDIQAAAWKWVEDESWPPRSPRQFTAAIMSDRKPVRQSEPEPPGYAEFVKEYRAKGGGVSSTPVGHDRDDSPKTPGWAVKIHTGIMKDILDKNIRCPREFAKHDIFAAGDAEEKWYLAEFNKRARRVGR